VWDAINDETALRLFCVTGGLGSGKSHGGSIWDLERCFQNGVNLREAKPSKSWTVAPNYRICETLLELTLQAALDVYGLKEGVDIKLRRSFPRSIDFTPMGISHRLMLLSADNPEHFVSDSITHWRWSEVGVSKAAVYEKLQDRLRDRRGRVLQGLAEGTPEGLNHWADLADIKGDGRDRTDATKNRRRFIVETGDNAKNLTPGYLEALRSRYAYDKSKLTSYEKGLFVPFTKGSAYWEWFESRNVSTDFEPTPALPIFMTWDFNIGLAWIAGQRQPYERSGKRRFRYCALDESSGVSGDLLDAIAEFAVKFPLWQYRETEILVHGDRSGHSRTHRGRTTDFQEIAKHLRQIGYQRVRVVAPDTSNPEIRSRLQQVAKLMVYGLHTVHPRCVNLIRSYTTTALVPKTWQIAKPQGETWTHFGDAAGYWLFWETEGMQFEGQIIEPAYGVNVGM
jgi:hypothetical protein